MAEPTVFNRLRVDKDAEFTGPIKGNSVQLNSGELQATLDGLVVPVATGLGVKDAFDPDNTSTPVQDAIDAIADNGYAGAGTVLLPPGVVEEGDTITHKTGVSIIGMGVPKRGATTGGSIIHTQINSIPAIEFLPGESTGKARLDGFCFKGQGDDAGATDAMDIRNAVSNLSVGTLMFEGWYGRAIAVNSGTWFQSTVEHLLAYETDAGDSDGLFDLGSALMVDIRGITAYPTSTTTGSGTTILKTQNADIDIGYMNLGGSTRRVMITGGSNNQSHRVGHVNYEPSEWFTQPSRIFDVRGQGTYIGTVLVNGSANANVEPQDIYWLGTDAAGYHIGQAELVNGATLGRARVAIVSDTARAGVYMGKTTNINNVSGVGTLTGPVTCLGDLAQFTG